MEHWEFPFTVLTVCMVTQVDGLFRGKCRRGLDRGGGRGDSPEAVKESVAPPMRHRTRGNYFFLVARWNPGAALRKNAQAGLWNGFASLDKRTVSQISGKEVA